jgi:hypothetical protein
MIEYTASNKIEVLCPVPPKAHKTTPLQKSPQTQKLKIDNIMKKNKQKLYELNELEKFIKLKDLDIPDEIISPRISHGFEKSEQSTELFKLEKINSIDSINDNDNSTFDVPCISLLKKEILCDVCENNITEELQFRCIDCCDKKFFVCFECVSYTNMKNHDTSHKIIAYNKLPQNDVSFDCCLESNEKPYVRNRIVSTFEPFITHESNCNSSISLSSQELDKHILKKNTDKFVLLRNNVEICRNYENIMQDYKKNVNNSVYFDNCDLHSIKSDFITFMESYGENLTELSFERNFFASFFFQHGESKIFKKIKYFAQ